MIVEIRRDPLQTLEGWLNEQGLSPDKSHDSVSRINSFYSLLMRPLLGKDTKLGIGATRTDFDDGRAVYLEVGIHLIERRSVARRVSLMQIPEIRTAVLRRFANTVSVPLFPNPEIHWRFDSDESTLGKYYSGEGAVYAGMLGARFPIRLTGFRAA